MIGKTLSHYKIVKKLGSGGMGDVYVAEDTKLSREVALKVLPPEVASAERRKRFEREAKAVAALNHPNIVHVYSVEEAEGVCFITMELVRGKNLSVLLPDRGFSLKEFFEIAIPLADAVAAAHQAGITHRDLKPDNVMLNEEGGVKVLDFGLAKPAPGVITDTDSKAPTEAMTRAGSIVGTVHYMSPEQAEGKTLDHRTDLFSLGIILYEMATGERPFKGDTAASVLSSIIKDTPPSITEVNTALTRDLGKIIKRCLVKDLEYRYHSAKDLRNDLMEAKQEVESGEVVVGVVPLHEKPTRWPKALWLAGAVMGLSIIAWMIGVLPTSIEKHPRQAAPRLVNPVMVTSAVGVEDYPAWSADGETLAYSGAQNANLFGGNWDIWVSRVHSEQPVNRTSDHIGEDWFPSWSPDGSQIAFISSRGDGGVFVMPALAGAPRKVTSAAGVIANPPQWSPDGAELAYVVLEDERFFVEILLMSSGASRRVPFESTEGVFDLAWSPDGRFFAFVRARARAVQVTQLAVLRLDDGREFAITDGQSKVWSPSWSADGRSLYVVSNRGGTMDLWLQSLNEDGTSAGPSQRITTGLEVRYATVSADEKKLAYSKGRRTSNVWRVPILEDRPATWADGDQITSGHAFIEFLDLSPDGDRLLVSSNRAGNPDLWILPSEGGSMRSVTTDPTPDWLPSWSSDGEEIAFYAYRSGNRDIWLMPAEGGPARQITDHPERDSFPVWSPDGQHIAFDSYRAGNEDIWIVSVVDGEVRQLTTQPSSDRIPSWSPDGKWIVFISERGPEGLWRVSVAGGEPEFLTKSGNFPRWSPDGERVYFTGTNEKEGNIWALSPEDGSERPMTDLSARPGRLGAIALATDGRFLYFTWEEDLGDIWVMDVVRND